MVAAMRMAIIMVIVTIIATATIVAVAGAPIFASQSIVDVASTTIRHRAAEQDATIILSSAATKSSEGVMKYDASKVTDARQLWTNALEYAVYTTAAITSSPANGTAYGLPKFALGDFLNDPVEAYALDTTGATIFNYQAGSSEADFDVSTARHINTYPAGDVDIAVAQHSGTFNPPYTCTLFGFNTKKGLGQKPAWTYTIPSCFASMEDADRPALAMSDDGSTVAFALASNVTGSRDYGTLSAQLHVLDGQTGKLLFINDLRTSGQAVSVPTASISRHGEFTAFNNGNITYIHNRDGSLRGKPIDKKQDSFTHICPMGTFITYGEWDGHVAKWNASLDTYVDRFVVPGRDAQGNGWFVQSMATTINGGGSHPDGCLAAFGWSLFSDNARQVKVEIYNMFTAKLYWSWTSLHTVNVQTVPYLSFHMGYLAVAHWGNDDGTEPQTLLFGLGSAAPLFTFNSPGSMFDVEVAVMSSPIPSYTSYEDAPVPAIRAPDATDQIWITAGGKHVHASQMGNGGDAYAFTVTVNAAAAAPHRAV